MRRVADDAWLGDDDDLTDDEEDTSWSLARAVRSGLGMLGATTAWLEDSDDDTVISDAEDEADENEADKDEVDENEADKDEASKDEADKNEADEDKADKNKADEGDEDDDEDEPDLSEAQQRQVTAFEWEMALRELQTSNFSEKGFDFAKCVTVKLPGCFPAKRFKSVQGLGYHGTLTKLTKMTKHFAMSKDGNWFCVNPKDYKNYTVANPYDDGKTEMAVVTDVSMVRHTTMRRAPSSQSDFSLSLFLLSYFLKYPLRVPDSDTFSVSYPL